MSELPRHYSAWLEASALLLELRQSGALLGIKDGQLSLSAPKGAISESLREALSGLKAQLLALLQLEQRSPLQTNNSQTTGPLTSSQSRMWFLQKLHPNSDLLNLSGACQITGPLDLQRLQVALQTLGQRQSALRTVFPEIAGKAYQEILPKSALQLEVMPQNNAQSAETQALTEIKSWCAQPFDLSQGPLMRMGWWPLGEQRGILAWSLHHLISDGWSTGVLLRELLAAYHGIELPLPVISGLDLAQQAFNETPWSEQALAFYRQALAGFPTGLDLPGETCPCESGPAEEELDLPETLWDQIVAFGKATALTPFQICLTAWTVLLSRYGIQERMIIGTPVSGRTDLRLENLIGCLINTLLLPLEVMPELNFAQNCGLHARQFQVHLLWQDLPFEKAVAALPKSEHPLPEVYFVFQNSPLNIPPLDFEVQWQDLPQQPPPFPLTLTLEPGRLQVRLSSALAQLGPELLRQILRDYLSLLSRLLAQPEQPLSEIRLLPPEAQSLSLKAGMPMAEIPIEGLIHQFVERQAAQAPERPALLWQGQAMSYGELNQRANGLARVLRRQGLAPGMRAAVWLEVGPEALICLLAILKAGALYLPIDQDQPPLRAAKILNFAQPHFLLAAATLQQTLPDSPQKQAWNCLDPHALFQVPEEIGDETNLDLPISPDDLAYMIFTSGSTGEPNGVEITHGQVARLFPAAAREVDLSPEDTWVLFHSLAFDYSVWEIWGAFYAGAQLLLIPRSLTRDSSQFWQTLIETPVTGLNLTPSALRALQGVLQTALPPLPPLRWLILSGEKLELGSLKPWFACFGEQVAVYNSYGITETTVFVTFERILPEMVQAAGKQSPVGHPLQDLGLALLGKDLCPVPVGVAGEITVTGAGLARGYFNNPTLTKQRFSMHPFLGRVYHSGDYARQDLDGRIHYLSRRDTQLKIRGYRLEAAEIEAALLQLPAVIDGRVALRELRPGQHVLIAYLMGENKVPKPTFADLRKALQAVLPPAWLPDHFVWVPALPLTLNGKLDVKALPLPQADSHSASLNQIEKRLHQLLQDLNGGLPLDPEQNFMDQGLHSLLLVEAQYRIEAEFGMPLTLMDLFAAPTLRQLAQKLQEPDMAPETAAASRLLAMPSTLASDAPIAVIGMVGRFPGADSVEALWELLCKGETGLKHFSREELLSQGVSELQLDHPHYVPVTGVLPDIAAFDRELFQLSAAEARLLDPQQRLMLETAWQALEQAGYGDCSEPRPFGVFAGSGISRYLLMHLGQNIQGANLTEAVNPMQALLANDKDYLATRVAYHLNLTGPALAVQTACSTSLVAVHLACESLRRGECELALAGGVSLDPDPQGYLHLPGGIYSADGACRPFEAEATGIVGGSGVALVVLKPLAQAQADGDLILGQILSSAINNDGKQKLGFTAPGIAGQVAVLRKALARSGIRPAQIRYLEAHGTGTALGDSVEIQALTEAWTERQGQATPHAAIGSLKANLGHLDAAAGVAGLIKALLVLLHKKIPPQPGFTQPSPRISWQRAPVYPARLAEDLSQTSGPLCAAVSSFGIGGTNAHAILAGPPESQGEEQMCESEKTALTPQSELILLSAHTELALLQLQNRLLDWHRNQKLPINLTEMAFSLALGRQSFAWRLAFTALDSEDLHQKLLQSLANAPVQGLVKSQASSFPPPLLWLLPGLGSQVSGLAEKMARLSVFSQNIETCLALIQTHRFDLAERLKIALYGSASGGLSAAELADPTLMQPLIFLLSYALGQTWFALGLQPALLLGHSFGEYAALCLGGHLALPKMLDLVCRRGELFASVPGFTWAVQGACERVKAILPDGVCIAADNAEEQVTVAGPLAARDPLRDALHLAGLRWIELPIPHAVHHPLLEPILDELSQLCASQPWQKGTWQVYSALRSQVLSVKELSNPDYWRAQTLEPVPFKRSLNQLLFTDHQETFLPLETGPGRALSALLRGKGEYKPLWGLGTEASESRTTFLNCLGQLWQRGFRLERKVLFEQRYAKRVLPGTPFERENYWFSPTESEGAGALPVRQNLENWFYSLEWQRRKVPLAAPEIPHSAARETENLIWLIAGQAFKLGEEKHIKVVFDCRNWQTDAPPDALLKWALASLAELLKLGLTQLCFLMPAVQVVTGAEQNLAPDLALLLGLARVLPSERPAVHCLWLESDGSLPLSEALIKTLLDEAHAELALRNRWLWEPQLLPQILPQVLPKPVHGPVRTEPLPMGTYLITGGSGEIGGQLAQALPAGSQLFFLGREAPVDLATLFEKAAGVHWIAGDMAVRQSWDRALAAIQAQTGELTGVLHAGGSPDQHWLLESLAEIESSPDRLQNWLQDWPVFAKWLGAKHLLLALQTSKLTPRLILFCSALSSFSGQPGQWAYTAANAALNALAGANWQTGLPVQSIAWGAWKEGGMAKQAVATLPHHMRQLQTALLAQGIDRESGKASLSWIYNLKHPNLAVSPLKPTDLLRLSRQYLSTAKSHLQTSFAGTHPLLQSREIPSGDLPQSPLESEIAKIWGEALGVANVGREESWQQLGGDSLLALQVRERLAESLKRPVSPALLFQGSTVASLAETLQNERVPSLLVPLRREGTGQTLFCVHAISGTVFPFQTLARHLSGPFFALQSQGLTGQSPHLSLEAMAAAYLDLVMHDQLEGPLLLAGWSFGALVAFEMARQALARGRAVSHLVLIDLPLPPPGRVHAESLVRMRFDLEMQKLGLSEEIIHASADASISASTQINIHENRQASRKQTRELLYAVFEANLHAARTFKPTALNLPATLVVAEAGLAQTDSRPGKGWGDYLAPLTLLTVPGDHYSMLEGQGAMDLARLCGSLQNPVKGSGLD